MFGIDLTTVLAIVGALVLLFLVADFVFAGGGMTSAVMGGAMHCGAATMNSPYGWVLVVALVVVVLAIFGVLFGYR